MQVSRTTHGFYPEDNKYKDYKPVKHIRSDDSNHQRQHLTSQSSEHKTRSMSSSFRHSIRHLTSCASVRRKPGRNNKHDPPTTTSTVGFEDENRQSPKTLLLPTKSSISSQKQSSRSARSTTQSTREDIPPVLPPRKPLDKKNSVQIQSVILNPSVINNSSTQISSNIVDDTSSSSSLAPARILPSKEISTSLVNLMGTASDSISDNNITKPTTQEIRPRKHSVFSFLQRLSTTPAATVDRLGILESLSNMGTAGMVESPSSQRIVYNGNHTNNSYTKSSNEYTWCYEHSTPIHTNSATSFDQCLPQLEIDDKPLIYRQQFLTNEHFNWYGISENSGPVIISYKHLIDQNKQRSVISIVRTRQRTSIETISNIHSSSTPVDILRRICEQCAITDVEYFDPVLCDGSYDLLLKYDESHVSNQHKFGIIYQRENQLTEEDIFSNEIHNNTMEKFLNLIGTRVKLKDFRGFRGGLDVKSDQTGTESVYEQFHNHEIMFHVSTLLPHSKSERQQLERKRHIGNDIVAIIFQENETIFNPECIASQFLHVYIVITPLDNDGTQYKVSVIHRDSVPSFGPHVYQSNIFQSDQIFKQWLLTKLINAEMASCKANTIQKYQERTKMNLFENLYRTLHENNRPLMSFVLNHSQYKHECDIEQQQQQQKDEIHNNTSIIKTPERHTDSSLLGSVRRRLIAPKLRVQNSPTIENGKISSSGGTAVIIPTPPSNNTNDSRSKTRSMTMDLRRSASRESLTTNGHQTGKMTSFFSSTKNNTPRLDKSTTSRSLLDHENVDSVSSTRSNTKFLSPATCPSSPWTSEASNGFVTSSSTNELNHNGHSYSHSASFHFNNNNNNKFLSDDFDNDNHIQLLTDDLQSSTKDDLIKFVLALQQQHSTKIVQMDQIHTNALKRLEMQLMQQQNTIDRDSP